SFSGVGLVAYNFENLGRYSFFYAQKIQAQQGFWIMKLSPLYTYISQFSLFSGKSPDIAV
ncbi:hypothetical protein, partial [Paenibacillus typhae]|uniref:hypothetical protein n=1 Tax=Paenibacillus typhae TaxID=1174501 RepID=UPI0039EE11F0